MVRKLRGEQLTIPNPTERDVVTLYHRHSIEEIMAMTGLSKARIQGAILRAISNGKVKPYAPSEG
jgi:hypothetical protein